MWGEMRLKTTMSTAFYPIKMCEANPSPTTMGGAES